MKNIAYFLIIFTSLLFVNISKGQSNEIKIPKLNNRVNDYAEILTDKEELTLNQKLKAIEDSVGSQIAILTIDTLMGTSIETFSLETANNWKLGRKKYDDGLLITVSIKDRRMRIEVGYGLELIVTDDKAKNIIDTQMVAEFRNGNYYKGLLNSILEISTLLYNNQPLIGKRN